MTDAPGFDTVIAQALDLGLHDPADPRWAEARARLLPTPERCSELIEWARLHPRWQFNVAEAADQVCAKPIEAAVFVLSDIVAELLDEGG
ncbi:MAG: hypothetical protein AB1Z98_29280 [Nannocystaceae bacterium]